MQLQSSLKAGAPNFCKLVRKVNVFRMEEWSDVTELIADRKAKPGLTGEEELEEQEDLDEAATA